ncbi:acyl-CoA dehydrogenase family protein [Rhizobium herbae]|uniref:Alkylation response protein AidB-like acyl-CoA dehydrogenase n=1 Tax=Rhizobium herbae TaxID=508661 RepID=A0ABS4EU66_9HYPH|nr:oxidoreductase [Rhizobium herbae]MBP1861470.1 alkylation response protein AidB-like acyl-CoA dehydrogenase [Rhizobium herbae]
MKQFEHPAPSALDSPYSTAVGRKIRDKAKALVPLLRKNAGDGEKLGALTAESLKALTDIGAFKLSLPTDFGGHALGARDVVEIVSEIGRGDGAAGWMVFVAGGLRNVLAFPEQAVQEIFAGSEDWIGPLAAGASVFATKVGSARRVDGGWMVSGSWHFGSGCKHAQWMVVGVEYETGPGMVGRAIAVLKASQVEIIDNWHVMGMKATSSNSLTVREEQFVPDQRFMDLAEFPLRMDETRQRYQGLASKFDGRGLMLLTNLTHLSIVLGMARGALETYIDMARKQQPFNLPYPRVADMASTQICAAKAYAMIKLAETTVHSAADLLDRHAIDGIEISAEQEQAMMMENVYAAHTLDSAVGTLQLSIGSATANENNAIQRFVRDIRVAMLHGTVRLDPTAEIFGRQLMGIAPFPMFAGGLPDRGPPPAG